MRKLHERVLDSIRHYAVEGWYFVSSALFLRNVGRMFGILLLLFIFTTWWMRCYTRHGQSSKVGNYTDMRLKEAAKKIRKDGFSYVLSDSVFMVDKEPGLVLDQNPKPAAKVKKRRKIYLTITKQTPDLVSLPDLVGNYDFDQYSKKLKLLGIKTKIRELVFDNKEEENTIKYFYFGEQKITDQLLREGVKVPMGSTLEFVISTRSGGSVAIPDLTCLTLSEAEFLISASNLRLGFVHEDTDVTDAQTAFVYKQNPSFVAGSTIPFGGEIELYISETRPAGCGE